MRVSFSLDRKTNLNPLIIIFLSYVPILLKNLSFHEDTISVLYHCKKVELFYFLSNRIGLFPTFICGLNWLPWTFHILKTKIFFFFLQARMLSKTHMASRKAKGLWNRDLLLLCSFKVFMVFVYFKLSLKGTVHLGG